jgi:tetratricopeptide (TPR) repeat protein
VRLNRPQPARAALDASRLALESRIREIQDDPDMHGYLGMVYAALGRREDALRASARISEICPVSKDAFFGPNYAVLQAKIDALLGEPDRAIERLENLLRIPSCITPEILRLDPDWDRIRHNPRFRRLAQEKSAAT